MDCNSRESGSRRLTLLKPYPFVHACHAICLPGDSTRIAGCCLTGGTLSGPKTPKVDCLNLEMEDGSPRRWLNWPIQLSTQVAISLLKLNRQGPPPETVECCIDASHCRHPLYIAPATAGGEYRSLPLEFHLIFQNCHVKPSFMHDGNPRPEMWTECVKGINTISSILSPCGFNAGQRKPLLVLFILSKEQRKSKKTLVRTNAFFFMGILKLLAADLQLSCSCTSTAPCFAAGGMLMQMESRYNLGCHLP